jgi:hypothetical protein
MLQPMALLCCGQEDKKIHKWVVNCFKKWVVFILSEEKVTQECKNCDEKKEEDHHVQNRRKAL